MADELIPPVDLPRSATSVLACGVAESFFSCPLDVASHGRLDVRLWRTKIAGSRTRLVVAFEQSDDRVHWVSGRDADVEMDAPVELVLAARRRWFRARVDLVTPESSTRWKETLPGRDGALDLLENGRAMLSLRADAIGQRDPPGGSD